MATPLELIIFPTEDALTVWCAQDRGFFARQGLAVTITDTPNSGFQIQGLVAGRFHLAQTAIDNVIAYQEGQGTAPLDRPPDLFAFMGGGPIDLPLVAAPAIKTYADLKGATLGVNSLSTGFAFVLRRMLEAGGLGPDDVAFASVGGTPQRWAALKEGKQAATLLAAGFLPEARAQGFNLLGQSLDVLGRYQGTVLAASRAWAAAHEPTLIAVCRAVLAALDWLYDPANLAAAAAVLRARLPRLPEDAALAIVVKLTSSRTAFARRGEIDHDGVKTVLALRTRWGQPQKRLDDPARYIDTRALAAALTEWR